MGKMKIGLTVISILLAVVKASEDFKIYRRKREGDSVSVGGTDSFKIPSSLCQHHTSDTINCKRFNARPLSYNSEKCYCSCHGENNTFIFTDGQWTCLNNSALRELLGEYKLLFSSSDRQLAAGRKKAMLSIKGSICLNDYNAEIANKRALNSCFIF